MRTKINPLDLNKLIDADDIDFKKITIKGEMRKIWPAIHHKLTEKNWTARQMVKWLEDQGAIISVDLFRVYLHDLDRERGYNRSTNTFEKKLTNDSPRVVIKPATGNEVKGVLRHVDPVPTHTSTANVPVTNPLRALSSNKKDGEFTIPEAKFEVDNS